MKKIVTGILAVAVVAAMGTVGAFAAGNSFGRGQNYVDANGDGVCDNYGTCKKGQYFVDVDGDGVCDNYGTSLKNGMGKKMGRNW